MSRVPNTALRLLLDEAEWTGARLASAVRGVAAEHGRDLACDRGTVSRWLSGTRPRPPAPGYLLEALSRRLGWPVTAAEAGLTRSPAAVPDLDWEADAVRALSALTRTDLDPARRHLLRAGVYSLTALTLPQLADDPGHPRGTGSAARRVGRAEAEQMQTMATMFADAAETHGGGHVRTALAAYLNRDVTPWLHAPATDAQRCQLLSGAAQLTILLAAMSADDGADALAQRYHRTAARLAAEAGDHATYAVALRGMATHAHDLGHHTRAAVHLAEHAAETAARHASGVVQAYTRAHLAVAQARDDRHGALTALAAAERLHHRADTTHGPFTAYSVAALYFQRAQTLTALGDRTGAIGALTASLRQRTPNERHARTLTHALLAETLLTIGHLDESLTHWHAFLDDYPVLHSDRATRRLTAMRQFLRPHIRHPGTRTLLARATTALR